MANIHAARWWHSENTLDVRCTLCPRRCLISPGETGFCSVRINTNGQLSSISYGHPVTVNIDPIEKKPLARFMPGSKTLSFGTFGCNLNCTFCQNDSLSRGNYQTHTLPQYVEPEKFVEMALKHGCQSISYTYNEPTVFAEYVIDTAIKASEQGLKNVLVTNGFITQEAALDLYPHIDAANIDMKGFSEDFYHNLCGASLNDVLESIKYFYSLGKHLELTNLVIPGQNDAPEMLESWFDWVKTNLDQNVPLHFSAYHPAYKMQVPRTPPETIRKIRARAIERGFSTVFNGNI